MFFLHRNVFKDWEIRKSMIGWHGDSPVGMMPLGGEFLCGETGAYFNLRSSVSPFWEGP